MKFASILLALVVVLGFVSEARAQERAMGLTFNGPQTPELRVRAHDYTVIIGGRVFGIADKEYLVTHTHAYTILFAGPLGSWQVPFTAPQWFAGFCIVLALPVISPLVLAVRWKKRRTAEEL